MCSTKNVISPSGILYKKPKIADPLGVTNTVIGDPTGRIRRTKDQVARQAAAKASAEADAKDRATNPNKYAMQDAAADAKASTDATIADRLRRRSAYGMSLLGSSYSSAYGPRG